MVRYSGFIGQTGGSGGGDGNYAVINITYDVGEQVIVTHNGETYEAPDTSGIWLFGCEENGSYVCSLVNSAIPQSVTITISEKGQMEYANLTTQVINYQPLYLYGDEYKSITGGWTYTATITGGGNAEGTATSGKSINYTGYTGGFFMVKGLRNYVPESSVSVSTITFRINKSTTTTSIVNGSASLTPADYSIQKIFYKDKTINDTTTLSIKLRASVQGTTTSWYTIGKGRTWLEATCAYDFGSTLLITENKLYGAGFTKNDDISCMSAYGSTINDILANSVNLFKDKATLSKMVKLCTGNFMIQALGNVTCITAMNASANKYILLANEHWAKFISFLSM